MTLPVELQTAAWTAAFRALRYEDASEAVRDQDFSVRTWAGGWSAEAPRFYPCCGHLGDAHSMSAGSLEALAVAIVARCADDDAKSVNGCPVCGVGQNSRADAMRRL